MNPYNGSMISGKITDENDKEYFFQKDGVTYSLDKKEIKSPLKIGSNFTGFAYENENHKNRITRNVPDIQFDQYSWGKVVTSKHDLGVFVDIGLPDKDIAVSMDDLPDMKQLWPEVGDKLLIAIKRDKKNRLWGELADDQVFKAISQPVNNPKLKNHDVTGIVVNPKRMGTKVLTDHYNMGFIDHTEEDEQPRLGETIKARVIGIRPNKSFYLSLRPQGYEVIGEDAQMILTILQNKRGGTLPYNDKSDAKEITKYFGISKSQFKRALGHLLKERLITQNDEGIELVNK